MQEAFSTGWRSDGRGFWTKRKKTATSLLSILALIAGIAVAFKLFDREVPNNVVRDASVFAFEILKQEEAVGDTEYVEAGETQPIYEAGLDQFPGDTRSVDVRIRNTNEPARAASFQLHIDQDSIEVNGCDGIDPDTGDCTGGTPVITPGSADWTRFVNFWTLEIEKETIFEAPVVGEKFRTGDFETACEGGLRELLPNSPCELGRIEGAGSDNILEQELDERDYVFSLTEIDDGSDQSAFKGWTITFTFVFNARVPALDD